MSDWPSEIMRSSSQLCYWRDYRYAQGGRGNELDFQCDILAPRIEAEVAGGPETFIGGDWLRRYMTGGWNRRTGHYYYTIPTADRLRAVHDFVLQKNLTPAAAVEEHMGDAGRAARIAALRGYDSFADQKILAGTFRGLFHGAAEMDEGRREAVLLIHFLPGEAIFRTRLFQAYYRRGPGELDPAFTARINAFDFEAHTSSDAFAGFGTNEGRIFGGADQRECRASDFSLDKKGRRVRALSLAGDDDDEAIRMTLCRKPGDIDRALGLLHRMSVPASRLLAAE